MARDVEGRVVSGRRPVEEALRAGGGVRQVLLAREARGVDGIRRLAAAAGVPVRMVPRGEIESRSQGSVSQGVLALCEPFHYAAVQDVLKAAALSGESLLAVALDGVTDPRNLGAIARSAEAAGAHGLIVRPRRSSPVTPLAEKAAAGALGHLPVVRAANLATCLQSLQKEGVWTVALDASGATSLWDLPVAGEPLCVVVGDEGTGVSRLVRDRADLVVRIPLGGRLESLNASVAAGVVLFEIRRRRSEAGDDTPAR